MSLRPKKAHVAVSILGVKGHKVFFFFLTNSVIQQLVSNSYAFIFVLEASLIVRGHFPFHDDTNISVSGHIRPENILYVCTSAYINVSSSRPAHIDLVSKNANESVRFCRHSQFLELSSCL